MSRYGTPGMGGTEAMDHRPGEDHHHSYDLNSAIPIGNFISQFLSMLLTVIIMLVFRIFFRCLRLVSHSILK